MMHNICVEAESASFSADFFRELRLHTPSPGMAIPHCVLFATHSRIAVSTTETVAVSAVTASYEHDAACIVVLTTTGNSAR